MPPVGLVTCQFDELTNVLTAIWRIPDYRSARMQMLSPSFGSKSLPISSPSDYQFNWHMAIHPEGSRRAFHGFVSLYLYNDDDLTVAADSRKPYVKISMKMIRVYENMSSIFKQSHASKVYHMNTGGFGFHHFISRNYLLDQESCFIAPDESLSITLVIKHLESADRYRVDVPSLTVLSDNLLQFYEETILSTQEDNSNPMTDVTFKIDGRPLKANKFMLAARSPVFAAMFKSGMQESSAGSVIVIEDVEFDVMQAVLKYIYCGNIEETIDDNSMFVIKLFAAADKYQLKYLRKLCESFIASNLNPDTVNAAMIAGHLHDSVLIKRACFTMGAGMNMSELEDWSDAMRIPGLVGEMISFWHDNGLIHPPYESS